VFLWNLASQVVDSLFDASGPTVSQLKNASSLGGVGPDLWGTNPFIPDRLRNLRNLRFFEGHESIVHVSAN
jgi:hypothetical protein